MIASDKVRQKGGCGHFKQLASTRAICVQTLLEVGSRSKQHAGPASGGDVHRTGLRASGVFAW